MSKFNSGKPYHGSSSVQKGNLHGATGETDYFYFFCPRCPDRRILRLLDYAVTRKRPNIHIRIRSARSRRGHSLWRFTSTAKNAISQISSRFPTPVGRAVRSAS